jgi:hypothetical protein
MDDRTSEFDRDDLPFTFEPSDEELEAAADTVRWVWTRHTTSCGGANC